MAKEIAALRWHEFEVATEQRRRRESKVRSAFNTLIATGARGMPDPNNLTAEGAETIREAMRETARDCIRKEEAAQRRQVAEREASQVYRQVRETREKKLELRRRVAAKRAQEEEMMSHRREVEAEKQRGLESIVADQEANAQAKAESKRLWEREKVKRESALEALALSRRAAKEALVQKKEAEKEKEAAKVVAAQIERARAREEAKQAARVEATVHYAKRQEKVWQSAARFSARCEAEYEKELLLQVKKSTTFTEENLERLKARLEVARSREAAAKESFDASVHEVTAGGRVSAHEQ